QSNEVGELAVTNTFSSLSDCWMIGEDGFPRAFSEPAFDAARQVTHPIDHGSPDTPGQSHIGSKFNQLRALGETRTLVAVCPAVGSTTSVLWSAGTADNPPTYQHLLGATKH